MQLVASPGQLNTTRFALTAEQESAELGRMRAWGLPGERVGEAQGTGPAKSSETKEEPLAFVPLSKPFVQKTAPSALWSFVLTCSAPAEPSLALLGPAVSLGYCWKQPAAFATLMGKTDT